MSDITLRMADECDAEEILRIYSPYVKTTSITFEYEVPGIEEFKERIRKIKSAYPYIAAVKNGKIIGYAYASRAKERAAYGWNTELSIYVDMDERSHGIGSALYGALLDMLKLQNIQNVYGCITYPNEKSQALHKKFGFTDIGIFKNTGFKFGKWMDTIWMEKPLGCHSVPPENVININDIDKKNIEDILKSRSF